MFFRVINLLLYLAFIHFKRINPQDGMISLKYNKSLTWISLIGKYESYCFSVNTLDPHNGLTEDCLQKIIVIGGRCLLLKFCQLGCCCHGSVQLKIRVLLVWKLSCIILSRLSILIDRHDVSEECVDVWIKSERRWMWCYRQDISLHIYNLSRVTHTPTRRLTQGSLIPLSVYWCVCLVGSAEITRSPHFLFLFHH